MWVSLGVKPIRCTVDQFEQIGHKNGWPIQRDNEHEYIHFDLCSCEIEQRYVVKFLYYTVVWY